MAAQHDAVTERKRRKYVPRLDTPRGVRLELARLYTDARKAAAERGPLDTSDAYRLSLILGQLARTMEVELEAQLFDAELSETDCEADLAGGKAPPLRRIA